MSYPKARYSGASGEPSATFRLADAAPDLSIGVKTRVGYLATGATTEGLFGLYRWDMAAIPADGSTPAGHFHRTFAESFYVLSGTVSLYDGQRWRDATAGDFLHVPPGGVHTFNNNSGAAASMLVLFAPGAPREGYFEEIAGIAASGRTLSVGAPRSVRGRDLTV